MAEKATNLNQVLDRVTERIERRQSSTGVRVTTTWKGDHVSSKVEATDTIGVTDRVRSSRQSGSE